MDIKRHKKVIPSILLDEVKAGDVFFFVKDNDKNLCLKTDDDSYVYLSDGMLCLEDDGNKQSLVKVVKAHLEVEED